MVRVCFGPPVKLVKCYFYVFLVLTPYVFVCMVNNCLVHVLYEICFGKEPQLHCLAITIRLTTDTVYSVKLWFVN